MENKTTWRNPVLFQEKLAKLRLPKRQYQRIVSNPKSEDLLTWNVFATLKRSEPLSRWLRPFLKGCLPSSPQSGIDEICSDKNLDTAEMYFWRGRRNKIAYRPPSSRDQWLRKRYEESLAGLLQEWGAKRGRMEGATEVDVVIETDRALIFIEAKYLSDISTSVTYDPWRDQIARTIDVGTYQAQLAEPKREFFFVLLTPRWDNEYEERSRLYWYRMRDYREHPELLRAKLPHRAPTINPDCEYPIDFEVMARRIGWAYWADVISLADREVKAGHVHDLSTQEWQRVMEDFQYKGLI